MFDLGFSELFMIAIVALVVLGPERLPKAARFAGLWIRRARAQWQSVKSEFENELADEELAKSLRSTRDELEDVRQRLKESGESVRGDFQLDRDLDDPDDHETELGSASDPELKAMLEPDDESAAESDPNDGPDPDERGPDEPGPDDLPRRDPAVDPDEPAPDRSTGSSRP